jgi:hypothetical protein
VKNYQKLHSSTWSSKFPESDIFIMWLVLQNLEIEIIL